MNKKSSGSRSRKQRLTAVGARCADHVTPLYPQKLALISPTGGGRSVGIVRSRTKATEFSFSLCILIVMCVLFCVFSFTVSFCVLYVCKRVLYYCHRETTQLQLTNISMSILITIITTTIIIIITAVPLSTHSSSFYYHLLVPLLHELDLQTNKQTNTYHSRSQHAISTDTNKHILVPFSLPTWRTTATSSPSPFLLFAHNYVTLSVSKRTIRQEGTSAAKHTKALVKPYEANKSPR